VRDADADARARIDCHTRALAFIAADSPKEAAAEMRTFIRIGVRLDCLCFPALTGARACVYVCVCLCLCLCVQRAPMRVTQQATHRYTLSTCLCHSHSLSHRRQALRWELRRGTVATPQPLCLR
jgi:hypothetical protein